MVTEAAKRTLGIIYTISLPQSRPSLKPCWEQYSPQVVGLIHFSDEILMYLIPCVQ